MCQVERGLPSEVLGLHRRCVDGQFDTFVGDLADVGVDVVIRIFGQRHRIRPDEVFGLLAVEFERTVDATAPKCIVNTDIEHACALPLQIGIGIFRSGQRAPALAFIIEEAGSTIGSNGGIGAKAEGVTAHTIAHTQFQVGEHVLILHEWLLGDIPGSTHRREGTPLMILAKHRAAVATDGSLKHIAAVVAIGCTAIE